MKKATLILNIILWMIVFTANLPAEKVVVPLSKPGQPCTLKVNLQSGGITISGYNGKEVIINIEMVTKKLTRKDGEMIPEPPEVPDVEALVERELREVRPIGEKEKKQEEDLKGLKRIPNMSLNVSIQEEDNVVSITSESMRRTVQLSIQVPFNTSLKLDCYRNGDIQADQVTGDHEIKNYHGLIQLNNIAGSVIAEAYRGDITAVFARVDSKKAMSFNSFHGKIDVTFPAGLRANLKLKSDHGEIYTDFDIDIQANSRMKEKRSESGKYTVTIEKGVYGTINGGGPEIAFQTYRGNIIIRKGK